MSEERHNLILRRRSERSCTCGWEVKFGYGVAFTLAVFEAKRLLVFALEIFAEWQVIRFAGGFQPVALTLTDVTLGLPCALITVRTIRRGRPNSRSKSHVRTKRALRCLLVAVVLCAAMNTATLASIGYHISMRRETLVDVFNASMRLYVSVASYKYAIDEIQFALQCCGHTSYTDWFRFDWQKTDYASGEEMTVQDGISDEDYRDRGVPFSCCNLHAMGPCTHTEMTDDETINVNGCAEVISPILLRIVIVAYVMTSTLIVTQVLLAFLIARMTSKFLPLPSSFPRARRSIAPFTIINTLPRTYVPRFSSMKKSAWYRRPTNARPSSTNDACIKENRKAKPPAARCSCPNLNRCNTWDVAKIKPSVHEEHRVSVKRLRSKHVR
ncbi:RDS/peripherin-like protein xRDS35 [Odontomachus brunneus]|uniref:RDS/peripherin-like protein xRDS35 n=1 Tax=Odontomachus brunneus TaxID=486640 RepID=UPI0013F1A5E7|nr:RDS/peripherin-like protein xRDS35 [Odontomachus brunneus]